MKTHSSFCCNFVVLWLKIFVLGNCVKKIYGLKISGNYMPNHAPKKFIPSFFLVNFSGRGIWFHLPSNLYLLYSLFLVTVSSCTGIKWSKKALKAPRNSSHLGWKTHKNKGGGLKTHKKRMGKVVWMFYTCCCCCFYLLCLLTRE